MGRDRQPSFILLRRTGNSIFQIADTEHTHEIKENPREPDKKTSDHDPKGNQILSSDTITQHPTVMVPSSDTDPTIPAMHKPLIPITITLITD